MGCFPCLGYFRHCYNPFTSEGQFLRLLTISYRIWWCCLIILDFTSSKLPRVNHFQNEFNQLSCLRLRKSIQTAPFEGLFMHTWINLLDNAIKFSPSKGTIRCFWNKNRILLNSFWKMKDRGIADHVNSRIIWRVYQVDGPHKAEGNGRAPHLSHDCR